MRKFLFLIFCFCLFQPEGHAQKNLRIDSSTVIVRSFNNSQIKKYKADEDFQYDRLLEPPVSLWDRFWSWFWRKVGEMLSTEAGKTTFKTVLIVLAVAVIVYTIMKLIGMSSAGLFGSQNTSE